MRPIVLRLPGRQKRELRKKARRIKDASLRDRYRVIVRLACGDSTESICRILGMHRSTVSRVAERFRKEGEEGLRDHREDNGEPKVDARYLAELEVLVRGSPQDHGERRTNWTQELLARKMAERTGVEVSRRTMGRALRFLGARWGRPRPVVRCPWPRTQREARLRQLRRLVRDLPPDEVCLYEDEVDIHLNPKIGPDWMLPGQQKEVVTPGKNQKRYLAGALNPGTGTVISVAGKRKASDLFVALLYRLSSSFRRYRRIHVILDNYGIHSSRKVQRVLADFGGRIVLHFLPPYCPNENKIEQLWKKLHAEVTRNHRCRTIEDLMKEVFHFLEWRCGARSKTFALSTAA